MSNKILLIAGDPNSINSEIIFKCLKRLNNSLKQNIILIGNYKLLKNQFKKLNYKLKMSKINDINKKIKGTDIKIIDLHLNFKDPFNVKRKDASRYVLNSLNIAHKIALKNNVKGIINCPINKNLLLKKKIGVTEYLALKCKIKDKSEVMLIFNKKLSVAPVTTHIDVKNVSKKLNIKSIVQKSKTINKWFKKNFKKKPNIGILGLNPHNSEMLKNSEEKKIILPAVKRLKKLNIKVDGPLVSDSIFINDYKKYNVIIGMYHDQVLSPFKALYKFNAINITLGLKYLRTSPDHGTAKNIIKKKKAKEESLLSCIQLINNLKK